MEYTKGPWRISTTVPKWITAGDKSSDICKISDHCGFDDLRGRDLGNAKLIQASPDMYEACLAALDAQTSKEIEAAKKLCYAAIQKATL